MTGQFSNLKKESRPITRFLRQYRSTILNVLRIAVSIVLLTIIFTTIDLQAFWQVIQHANLWWLLGAAAMMLAGVVIRAWRWKILLDSIQVVVALRELTAIYFIGFLFNNLLPSGLGGDAIRMLEVNRYTERKSDTFTSVVVDRYLGLLASQAIALVALLLSWGAVPDYVAYFTILIFTGGVIAGLLLINRPLYVNLQRRFKLFAQLTRIKFIGNLFESFQRYPLPAIGRSYLVAFVFNITLILMYACIGWALGAQVTLAQFAITVPITSLFLILPISVGGLGVREWSFKLLYQPIGVTEPMAVVMSLLVYLIGNVIPGIIGGIIYLIRGTRGVVQERKQSEALPNEPQ
jgi:hypothetical protein